MQLNIDKEFQKLIPPLQDTEYAQLEENIKSVGCQDGIKVWNGIIVDGHNRYKICMSNNIHFEVQEMHFEDRDEAIIWIIKNQFGRRNLLPFQRSELALKMKRMVQARAKEKQTSVLKQNATVSQKSDERESPIRTDEELAKMAGVSRYTIRQAEKIIVEGTPEQKERARTGGQGNTVNAIYNEIVNKDVTERKCERCGEVLPIDRFKGLRKVCKTCSEHRPDTKDPDIQFVRSVVENVRNYAPKEYTPENLQEDLDALNVDFIKKIKTSLTIHEDLLHTAEGRKKAIAALIQAGTAIEEIKGAINDA